MADVSNKKESPYPLNLLQPVQFQIYLHNVKHRKLVILDLTFEMFYKFVFDFRFVKEQIG